MEPLSKLLHEWQIEGAPPALDVRVLRICERPRRRPLLRRTLWAAALVGAAFLIVVTQAIPQTLNLLAPPPLPPFAVDSEYFRYGDDGSRTLEMFSMSYTAENGGEVLLGRTIPDHPLGTALGRTLDAVLPVLSRITAPRIRQSARPRATTVGVISCGAPACLVLDRWFFSKAESGPTAPCASGSLIGYETILGHPTIGVTRPMPNPRATPSRPSAARITMWMAPDLGCYALRLSIEEQQPDGVYRLVSEKQALTVHVKP
jgi:hypothetical protein